MNDKIKVLGTTLNEINFKILPKNNNKIKNNGNTDIKKLIFKKIDSDISFGSNKFGISAETKFIYKDEKFIIEAYVNGLFVVSDDFKEVLVGNNKNIAGSNKGDELGNKILPVLVNKFKTYLGILSNEAYGYNIIPNYNFKSKK